MSRRHAKALCAAVAVILLAALASAAWAQAQPAAAPAGASAGPVVVSSVMHVTLPANNQDIAVWKAQLDQQVLKLIAAGHMAPWRVQPGETESYFYFTDPAELILTLSRAKPYLSPEVAAQAGEYLAKEIAAYPPAQVALLPFDQGTYRESYTMKPADRRFRYRRWLWRSYNDRPRMIVFYALWQYAEAFHRWDYVEKAYPEIALLYDRQLAKGPSMVEEVAGLIGMARIAAHVGDAKRVAAADQARALLAKMTDFSQMLAAARKRYDGNTMSQSGRPLTRTIVQPLYNLVPEMARFLAAHHAATIRVDLDRLQRRYPLWYIPLPPHTDPLFGEGTSIAPDIRPNIFLGRVMVLGDPAEQMKKYLDIPAIPVGDLYYMQCLTALIESAGHESWMPYPLDMPAKPLFSERQVEELAQYFRATAQAPWLVSKAFPEAQLAEFRTSLAPETGALPGTDAGAAVDWQPVRLKDYAFALKSRFPDGVKNAVYYACSAIRSPKDQAVSLSVRNDEALAVWVNGKEVFRDTEGLGWMPGADSAPAKLQAGWNTVMLKLRQGQGDRGFMFRVEYPSSAPVERLEFAAQPPKQ